MSFPCLDPSTYPHTPSCVHRARRQHIPVEAGQGGDHLPKDACMESGTNPPEKAGWPRTISCKSGKGWGKQDWKKPCMTKVIIQGYIFSIRTQAGKARDMRAHTQAGGTSCFHQCLPGLRAAQESHAVHNRSLIRRDQK